MNRRSEGFTGDLFSMIPTPMPSTPSSMDFRVPVAELVSEVLRSSSETRWVIAGRISELTDVETSKALLDSYTSVAREASNLPLWKAPVVEAACNSRALAEWHAGVLGGKILWGAEVMDADIGKRERLIEDLQAELKFLKQQRRGMR